MGIARNVSATIEKEIESLDRAFCFAGQRKFFIVESDSIDDTVEKLMKLNNKYQNFKFVSLGSLEYTFPILWDRLAFVRNYYIKEFFENKDFFDCEYLVVSDLDGTNDLLDCTKAKSPFLRQDWAACFCNQDGHYYDILALRHPELAPDDCFLYERRLIAEGKNPVTAKRKAILARQKRIPSSMDWISVDSAFGGLAVYKREYLVNARYSSRTDEGNIICEHISFHKHIKNNGGKLFIVPSFINHAEGEHTKHFKLRFRFRRCIKYLLYEIGLMRNGFLA